MRLVTCASIALSALAAAPVGAQESYVLGRVIDTETQAPVNGAFVSMSEDSRRGVFTNPDGVFRLPGVKKRQGCTTT